MPGTTRELTNTSDFPRLTTMESGVVLPGMRANGQPVALPTELITSIADKLILDQKIETLENRDVGSAVGTFIDTVSGISSTVDGEYFWTTHEGYLQLFQNVSEEAALVDNFKIPLATITTSILNSLEKKVDFELDLDPFSVRDSFGNKALLLDAEGGFRTKKLDVSEGVKFGPALSGYEWSVSDGAGNVILGVDTDGRLVADFSLVGEDLTKSVADYFQGGDENYDYSVNHVFTCGQSLSVGQALPVQSGAQNYDNLMFYRGMRPQYDYPAENAATWYQSLVPAIEIVSPNPSWSSVLGETPAMGTGDMVKQLALAEDGKAYTSHEYKLLLSAPGWGATTIAQLSQGTSHYDRMIEQAGYGLSLANADGKTYAVQAVTWTQGESDYLAGTTQAVYLAALNTLIADTNTDVKAITGQAKDIVYIGYQTATHLNYAADDVPDIAMAQLECEGSNPLFFIATPMYHLPYQDGGHLTGVGSRWLGGYYGLAYKRIVIDGAQWRPLQPLSTVVQSNIIEAGFHVPHGKLAFDTAGVPARPDMGFELVDSADGALAISTVEIVDTDRVRITAAAAVPSGAKLRYGWSGATNAGQGNLRDTQGDDIVFDPNGINKPMHNWCVIFEKEL